MSLVPPSPSRSGGKLPSSTAGISSNQKRSYGCLMLPLPDILSKPLLRWSSDYIRPQHLVGKGLETDPHVTVKYGFTGDDQAVYEALNAMLRSYGPVKLRFTKLSTFPDSGDGEVLKLGVESRDLFQLYHQLSSHFICIDKHYPDYKAHLTLAYLDPEFAQQYLVYRTPLDGKELTLEYMIYSTPEQEYYPINLSSTKTLSWMNSATGGALVKPPEFMGAKPVKIQRNKNTLVPPRVQIKKWL